MDFENLAAKKKAFERNQMEAEQLRGIVAEGGEFDLEENGRDSYQDLLHEADIHDDKNKRIVEADHEEALAMHSKKLAEDMKSGTAPEDEKS